MTGGRGEAWDGVMPEAEPAALPPYDLDEAQRRLLESAVQEARASGAPVPHEVVRAEMLEEIRRLRLR